MFFHDWAGLGRTMLVGALAYFALMLLLRASGKRALSKMNAYDFIVTVALGSTLATVILSKDIALAEGITAFFTLIVLQFVITWLSVRSPRVADLVKAEPALLLHEGKFLHGAMRRERVLDEEIRAAIRLQGIASVEQVTAVVLETDGSLSVVRRSDTENTSGAVSALMPLLTQASSAALRGTLTGKRGKDKL